MRMRRFLHLFMLHCIYWHSDQFMPSSQEKKTPSLRSGTSCAALLVFIFAHFCITMSPRPWIQSRLSQKLFNKLLSSVWSVLDVSVCVFINNAPQRV